MLLEVAKRILSVARQEDAVARLGGDEFTVLVKSPLSRDATVGVANRVLGKISEPYQISGKDIRILAGIGVSMNYPKGDKPEDLLHEANQSMYQAANPKSMCIYMIRALSQTIYSIDKNILIHSEDPPYYTMYKDCL